MTNTRCYPWKRFWVPRDGSYSLGDGGYLVDPEKDFGRWMNPAVVPIEDILATPCLALLGEPGMGKTTALKSLRDAICGSCEAASWGLLYVDLRSYSSEDRLHRDIFGAPEFTSWINSTETLTIFLDSLDECMVHIRTVAVLLVDEFNKYSADRLQLRIACRTADWPRVLDDALPAIWGQGNYRAYELAPLRRIDVEKAAELNGIVPEAFVREVGRRDVVPLAIRPITLEFLLAAFKKQGALPGAQADLYYRGCLELCRDPSPSREAAGATGALQPEDRLVVAERIAAMTIFCKRAAIYLGHHGGAMRGEDLTLSELLDGMEKVDDRPVEVTSDAVQDVLTHTGLFNSRGQDRLGWSHWTYAEFLAARFVTRHRMTVEQMADIIMHPGSEGVPKVVPQLHETAAWMAIMNPGLVERIMSGDPQVLLRSAATAAADPSMRARLTDSLLRLFDALVITDSDMDLRRRYDSLNHPGLAGQLRPYITDQTRNVVVRRAAIHIAKACGVEELVQTLLDVALDRHEKTHIRHQAMSAVGQIGDDVAKQRLRLLLRCSPEEDPQDELRGDALRALWPGHLSAGELFDNLTPPRDRAVLGSYERFLTFEVVPHLEVDDLPAALGWVAKQPSDEEIPSEFTKLIGDIMALAWSHLDEPGVKPVFVKALLARMKGHDSVFGERGDEEVGRLLGSDPQKRKRLVRTVVENMEGGGVEPEWLCLGETRLVSGEDLPWLVEELKRSDDPAVQAEWSILIGVVFNPGRPDHVDQVLTALPQCPVLRGEFGDCFEPVLLDSERAKQMRQGCEERQSIQVGKKRRPLHPPLQNIVARCLDRFEAGDLEAWWRLNLDMTLEPNSDRYPWGAELNPDLTSLPGWEAMDESLRERCLAAAEAYLHCADPHTNEWLGTNRMHRPAFAGYRALRLLLRLRPDALDTLSDEEWAKWAPIILAYPEQLGAGDETPMRTLVARACKHAPNVVVETLMVLIGKENADHGHIYVIRRLAGLWDVRLANAILHRVTIDRDLKPGSVGDLLEELLEQGCESAVDATLSFVLCRSENDVARAKATEAAVVLLNKAPMAGWDSVWGVIQADPAFGREVLSALAMHHDQMHTGKLARELTEDAVAALYLWLCQQFPPAEDPHRDRGSWVGVRESIADLRDSLLTGLKEKGTRGAVAVLRRIADQQPEREWLKFLISEADRIRLQQTWNGVSPAALLQLARSTENRLVETGTQLLSIVEASLCRLEAKLRGTPPAVRDLWNDNLTPKDENNLSDYLKRHFDEDLRRRGIVANRDVRIRPTESPDFGIDAFAGDAISGAVSTVAVVVEVKGCWHRELTKAMCDQLKGRYLADNPSPFGLYVVGWFRCPSWACSDYRLNQTRNWTLEEARQFFRTQAEELSTQKATIVAFVLDLSYR